MKEQIKKPATVYDSYPDKSYVHLKVTNFDKFKQLIERANDQARQLQRTINELEVFDLDFQFSICEEQR